MKIACLGGGPAGLYFAISMKLRDPAHEIVVVERNRPDDTFGWGVVLSDETLENLARERSRERRRDPPPLRLLGRHRRALPRRRRSLVRPRLLRHRPQAAAAAPAGARARARRRAALRDRDRRAPPSCAQGYDLVVAADGLTRKVAHRLRRRTSSPTSTSRKCKFIWLGTDQKFDDAFTFIFEETEHGWIWAHAYQFDADTATFIVECAEATWRAVRLRHDEPGRDRSPPARRSSPSISAATALMTNARAPARLGLAQLPARAVRELVARERRADGRRRRTPRTSRSAPAPSSRMESAIALAELPAQRADAGGGLRATRTSAAPRCCGCRARRATRLEWFEHVERYLHLDPVQFNYSLLTRSQRISHENLRLRDKAWLESAETWFERRAGDGDNTRAPRRCSRRSGCATCAEEPRRRLADGAVRAVDGMPDRLAPRALRRARQGRRRARLHRDDLRQPGGRASRPAAPACTRPSTRRPGSASSISCTRETDAKIALPARPFRRRRARRSSAGRAMDAPLPNGNWPVIGRLGGRLVAAQPGAARDDARRHGRVRDEFVRGGARWRSAPASTCSSCTARTAICCRPSSRRSPTGAPTTTAARSRTACAFPLEVFHAVRAVWPAEQADLGAHLRQRLGRRRRHRRRDDAVEIARLLAGGRRRHHRRLGRPDLDRARGRSTAACSRRRSPTASATRPASPPWRSATSTEPDHVNSILMAGRADLVLPGAAASRRSLLDAARRGRARLRRRGVAERPTSPAAISCTGSAAPNARRRR